VLGILLILGFGGCTHCDSANPQQPGAGENTMTATERDNGRTFTMNRGDILDVKLEGIPGTGYSWRLVRGDPGLLEPRGELQERGTEAPVIGGPVTRVFRFRAFAGGSAAIEFHYKRVWETGVPPLKTLSIRVEIRSTPP